MLLFEYIKEPCSDAVCLTLVRYLELPHIALSCPVGIEPSFSNFLLDDAQGLMRPMHGLFAGMVLARRHNLDLFVTGDRSLWAFEWGTLIDTEQLADLAEPPEGAVWH